MNTEPHVPVLLKEVLQALVIEENGVYVDATFGRGGHSQAILERLGEDGRLLALDRDPAAVAYAQAHIKDKRFTIEHLAFSQLGEAIRRHGLSEKIDGLLFDLGVSSPQLDEAGRGFSFRTSGELDMRMDTTTGMTAKEWINKAGQEEIANVLYQYGDERYSRRIARSIVHARSDKSIEDTLELAEIISKAIPKKEKDKDPATRSFQAIRIFINDELGQLEMALEKAKQALKPGGRLLVITFHSLEDRIVKRFMQEQTSGDHYPPDLPITADMIKPGFKKLGKPIRPSEEEIQRNPRARSATLRMMEKIGDNTVH